VDLPRLLTHHLDALTAALDGSGDDLTAILTVLADDLTAAVASFAGLSITVVLDGEPITLTATSSATAATSLMLAFSSRMGAPPGNQIVFYAESPGALMDLAGEAKAQFGPGREVVLDGHLPPPTALAARTLDDLAQRSAVNQAVGFLIGQGYPPQHAHDELQRRADDGGHSLWWTAEDLLGGSPKPGAPIDGHSGEPIG
jgi:hypothetical protein